VGGPAAPPQRAIGQEAAAEPEAAEAAGETAQADAAALIEQLGSDSYETRRDAAEQLVALGLPAREALLEGLASSDLEIKRSCRRILADVLEADYQRRLTAFMNDKNGEGDHDLPGWKQFREAIGKDRAARQLFVEMQNAESGLMESYEAGQDAAADALRTRVAQVASMIYSRYNGGQQLQPSKGTVVALMFVSSDPALKVPNDVVENPYWQNIIQLSQLNQTLTTGGDAPECRVFGRWLLVDGTPSLMQRKLQMALQYNVPQGLPLALRMMEQKENNHPIYRAMAVAAIGKLSENETEARQRLEPLLADDSVCTQQTRVVQVPQQQGQGQARKTVTVKLELRDVALAWLIYVTGQKQEDYHRPNAKTIFDRMKEFPQYASNIHSLYFDSDEDRAKALEKWNQWAKEHPVKAEEQEQKPADDDKAARADEPADEKQAAQQPAPARAAAFNAIGLAAPAVLLAQKAAAAAAGAKQQLAEGEEEQEEGPQLELADRQDVQRVLRAARLIEDRQFADAATMLGEVLADEQDFTYQPDRGIPLQRGLKIEAERLLAAMPDAGIDAYRLAFEPSAALMLSEAVAKGDEQSLIGVVRSYFHTRAGAEATYLLGTSYLNSGHPLRAALCLERLQQRSRDRKQFEPALSLKLAACWSMAGMPEAAERVLVGLARRGTKSVDVAGDKQELFQDQAQALAWLALSTGAEVTAAAERGWPVYRGDASRNLSTDNGNPYLRGNVLCPVSDDEFVRKKIADIQRKMLRGYEAQLPSLHPLVVGETIVVRTATSVRALDFTTGELLWEAPFVDALRHLIEHHPGDADKQKYAEFVQRGLELRLWQDATFGTMSTDGERVFGIEELPFGLGGDYRRLVVLPDGRRRLDPGTKKSYNLLTAYDLKSGKIRWEAGGPPGEVVTPLAGAFFLGPPLPMGGKLYVVAEIEDEIRLVELDAGTGHAVWQLALTDRTGVAPTDANQLIMLAQMGIPSPLREDRTSGASPSSGGGVLVCPLSQNEYAAVDLTTRTVMWLYSTHEDPVDPRMAMMGLNRLAQKRMQDELLGADEHWADSSVTIAEDAVLLTPIGEEGREKIYCLGLADGELRWTADRGDGFYIAGVQDGRVLVAGRGTFRALKLSDGTPAWTHGRVDLPPGAVTSGRGYLGQDRYFLPLSSGEVAQIDLAAGKIVSRSRAPSGVTPGNLVRYKDAVLSQGVDGLRRFTTLDDRLGPLQFAVDARGDDPALLADCGEALLYSGRVAEAAELLQRARRIKSDSRVERLLGEALIEGLRTDLDQFGELVRDFEPADAELRLALSKAHSLALRDAGRYVEAFAALLEAVDAPPQKPRLVRVEYRREVRDDRTLAARFDELWSLADGEQRQAIDKQVAELLKSHGPESLLAFLPRHPLADEARLQAARSESSGLAGQLRLFELLESPAAEHRATAVARLASWLRDHAPAQAAPFYDALEGPLADFVCLDGKTGGQLAAELPRTHAVRQRADDLWPRGSFTKSVDNKNPNNPGVTYTYPVRSCVAGGEYAAELSLEVDQSGKRMIGHDAFGRKRLDVTLNQNVQNYIGGNAYSYARAYVVGDFVAAWIGSRVCAYDMRASPGKLLWSVETIESQNVTQNPAFFMVIRRLQMPRQANGLPGGDPLPFAMSGNAVFFQKFSTLQAVDALTGETLWTREAMSQDSDLLADGDRLFVKQSDDEDALVLSTLDGRELGRRALPSALHRVTIHGGSVLTWSGAGEQKTLSLVDAWNNRSLWEKSFPADSLIWLVSESELAVLDKQTLHVIRIDDGRELLNVRLDYAFQPESLVVTPSYGGYLAIVNKSDGKKANLFGQTLAMTSAEVHGRMFGIAADGKTLWTHDAENQMLRLNQPSRLPVVSLLQEMYEQINNGRAQRRYYELICIDRRDGKELHKSSEQNKSNRQLEYEASPEKQTLKVRTQLGSVEFKFAAGR
jgi:outer membrane protein assembly factor BamB